MKKITNTMYVQPRFETVASPGILCKRSRDLFEYFGKISLPLGGEKFVKKLKGTSAPPDYAPKLRGIHCKYFRWELISTNAPIRIAIEFLTALAFAAALINFASGLVAPRHLAYSATLSTSSVSGKGVWTAQPLQKRKEEEI
jgi:hypothetical protein